MRPSHACSNNTRFLTKSWERGEERSARAEIGTLLKKAERKQTVLSEGKRVTMLTDGRQYTLHCSLRLARPSACRLVMITPLTDGRESRNI
jgi:hypothetical protein